MNLLIVLLVVAIIIFIVLMIFVITFVNKATKLIEETRDKINKQSEQFTETIEKIDILIIDIHKFVNLASESLKNVNDMSEKLSLLINKVDDKSQNLIEVFDQVAVGTKSIYDSIHTPISNIIDFFQKLSGSFSFLKSILPKKKLV